MGEYVKYQEEDVSIGTMYNLYYVSYEKFSKAYEAGLLSQAKYNSNPKVYLKPDSGFGFRFPFPDEKELPFGEINGEYKRGVPIKLDPIIFKMPKDWKIKEGFYQPELYQQELVRREPDHKVCLASVLKNPDTGETFLVQREDDVHTLLSQIVVNNIFQNPNKEDAQVYQAIVLQISKDYKMHSIQKDKERKELKQPRTVKPDDFSLKGKRK